MRTLPIILFLFSVLMIISSASSACDCVMVHPITSYFKSSEYMLVVKTVRIHVAEEPYYSGTKADVVVSEALKGGIAAGDTVLFDAEQLTNCSFKFREGKEYLVFAYRLKDRFVVYNCSYSSDMFFAKKTYRAAKKYMRRMMSSN